MSTSPPPTATRELIVREWVESERLKLLDKLSWEQWHGWKTVTPLPEVPVWSWREPQRSAA